MKPEYEEEIIETLESTFGTIEDKSSLASAILGAARNATEDNILIISEICFTRPTTVSWRNWTRTLSVRFTKDCRKQRGVYDNGKARH